MRKIILDCDPGMDDSMAIVLACKSKDLRPLAITAVNGNYPVDITCANALKTLTMLGRTDIPVGKGMSCPLSRSSPQDPFTHGADGQGENYLPAPTAKESGRHAIDLIIDTVKENPGEVTIIMTAPMTNLAMAFRKAPEIIALIPAVIAISGMFGLNEYAFANATGDTPQSEWNVYVDPEAAAIVYNSGVKLIALGLDVAAHFDVDFSPADLKSLAASGNPEAGFLLRAIQFARGRGFGAYCAVIDCLAVAYAIDPTLVETFTGKVGIETKDGLTLGMTVLDRRHHHVWERLAAIEIGRNVDYKRFMRLLLSLILL
jgi:purine nucleosidase/pyrimidine-specific ribonucleoside hydrolase